MTRIPHVCWHVHPLTLPQPQRHCSSCGTSRPFHFSGKVRLNANGRRLDAWLIYKCSTCDRTWYLPLLDRVAVADLPPADLAAMHASTPAWVRTRAFDLTLLGRHAPQVILPTEVTVTKRLEEAGTTGAAHIALKIEAPWPTGLRLDRLLAQELGLSRSALQGLQRTGGLGIAQGSRQAMKAPVAGSVVLQFDLDRIAKSAHPGLVQALGLPTPGAGSANRKAFHSPPIPLKAPPSGRSAVW